MGPVLAIFLTCSGLAFFAGATAGVVQIGRGYWKTRAEIRVPAKIESLEIFTHTGRGRTTSMVAAYTYEWEGQEFRSDYLSFFGEGMNLRSLMTKAFENGETVEAWIDPSDPAYSVIDRDWQWGEFIAIIAMQIFGVWATIHYLGIALFGSKPRKKKRHFGKPLLRLP